MEHFNTINVKWDKLAHCSYFAASGGNVIYVAHAIKQLIEVITSELKADPEEFRRNAMLFAHGLGVHVIGKAGVLLQEGGKPKPGIIIGLDPIGWLTTPTSSRYCLSPDAARKVYVFHTGTIFAGNSFMLGHMDFFVNGGNIMVKGGGCLTHYRVASVMRAMIGKPSTAVYVLKKPNYTYRGKAREADQQVGNIAKIQVNIFAVPLQEETPIPYPIFLTFYRKQYPFSLDNGWPEEILPYSMKKKGKFFKVKFTKYGLFKYFD